MSELGRYCRKSLRKRNVELKFETNESSHMDFRIKIARWLPILNQCCFEIPANPFFDSIGHERRFGFVRFQGIADMNS